jgi:hypothetical protein
MAVGIAAPDAERHLQLLADFLRAGTIRLVHHVEVGRFHET